MLDCEEGHEHPKAYEQCPFYRNEYQQGLEIIDDWLLDSLTKEKREEVLNMRKEYEQKAREQDEIDRDRRALEQESHEKGLEAVLNSMIKRH